MSQPMHVALDLSAARRVLFMGDVHGSLSCALAALARVGYDADAGDRLVMLGDLFDRGPDVTPVIDWLDANPTVTVMLGNHDDMLASSVGARPMTDECNPHQLFRNGGGWLLDFAPEYGDDGKELGRLMIDLIERGAGEVPGRPEDLVDPRIVAFARRIASFPVAATVLTPGGLTVGAIHADVPTDTWARTVALLSDPSEEVRELARFRCTWDRHLFKATERASAYGPDAVRDLEIGIPDVDHVFLGHSIVPEPRTAANLTWIDTGAYATGVSTVVDADAWVSSLRGTR